MNRPRDYAYEALAETTGSDLAAARGELNAALKSIREQMPEMTDSYLLAAEIHERGKLYRSVMEGMSLTPTALAKHWKRVFEESQQRKPSGTNRHAESECGTCGGDFFVLVATRPSKQSIWMKERGIEASGEGIEEWASCPDCGPEITAQRRGDGTMFVPPDPWRVREMMRG